MMSQQVNETTRELADQALFDRIASRYAQKDSVASSSLARKSQLLLAMRPVLDMFPNLGTVVDIGCGVGAPAQYLAGHYEHYIGVDQSEEMVRAARTFNRNNPRAEFVTRNIKAGGSPQDLADVVLSVGALHHMTELEAVMESLVRIAKPGAVLAVIEPQSSNPLLQIMRWIRGIADSLYSTEQIYFSEGYLRHLFFNHGITDISVDYQGFLTPPFAQVVMNPQALFAPLSRAAAQIDAWLAAHLPGSLSKISFNIVIIGRFPK